MLFNSVDFAIFLPIFFVLYWFFTNKNLKAQNALIVIASYFFYGCWDWRFLGLILFSTIVDYGIGILLSDEDRKMRRKVLLWISIMVNLGFLGFFKYYNFFLENFIQTFSFFGFSFKAGSLNIILPVGISFYTFQTLSYTIDVYKGKLKPTKDFIAFSAFVSFFPQLVAGPIERATNLLPQFYKKRKFDYQNAVDGLRQVLWGLFKKIVIADNAALYVNQIFVNYEEFSGSTLLLGGVLFAFQIYGDFSGYSDIAIGTSRLFGFKLMQNFAFPYFSRDIAEFWRRWHISLSTWFRDYLYIPLGGSKGGVWMKVRNTFIIFLVSGFWHGANWTFIAWGFVNACYFLPIMLAGKNRNNIESVAQGKNWPTLKELLSISVTFFLTVLAWVFFRAENIQHAFLYLKRMLTKNPFSISVQDLKYLSVGPHIILLMVLLIGFVLVEWRQRERKHGLEIFANSMAPWIRWLVYYTIGFLIFRFGASQQDFIYFQF